MRLTLALDPSPIEFGRFGDTSAEFPLVVSVGTLREAVRAGQDSSLGVGESPSVTVELDNADRRAAKIIGTPLRVRADVTYDDGRPFYSGLVSQVKPGRVIELTIES